MDKDAEKDRCELLQLPVVGVVKMLCVSAVQDSCAVGADHTFSVALQVPHTRDTHTAFSLSVVLDFLSRG